MEISAAGIEVGENGAGRASFASLPGAKASGRTTDGHGDGDGFGSVMKAAMAGHGSRSQAGGQKAIQGGRASAGGVAGESAKQNGAHARLAKAGAGGSAPKIAGAAETVSAGQTQAALAKAAEETEKTLPGPSAIPVSAGGDAGETAPAAAKTDAKTAGVAAGAAQAVVLRKESPEAAGKDGATRGTSRGALANLEVGGGGNVAVTVTKSANGSQSVAAAETEAETKASAGQPGQASGTADGKGTGRTDLKTEEKKDAGKQDATGPKTGPMTGQMIPIVPAGLMHAAMVAPALGNGSVAQAAASPHVVREPDSGSIKAKARTDLVSARSMAAAGNVAGQTVVSAATAAAQSALGIAGNSDGGPGGIGAGLADVAMGPGAAGGVADASANAVGAGSGGRAGAGHDSGGLLVLPGMGMANPHKQGGEKNEAKGVFGSATDMGSSAASGFTASLLQGHTGIGTGAPAAHHGLPHAAGGVGPPNPYARMDETPGHALVFASPQKMSVAVTDPSLGSFQVRAHNTGAQVAASLATASSATHALLNGHVPSLTAFLRDQRVDLAGVTVVRQPSLLGGETGPRDFGRQQQQSRSSGRGAKSRMARVGAAERSGRAGSVGSAGSAAEIPDAMADPGGGAAPAAAQGNGNGRAAEGGMASVDLMA